MDRGALAGLGALALLARLPGLGRSLWYDELFTLVAFAGSPLDALTRQVAANNHPPASLVAWAAGLVAGPSEVGLRLPFALLGAAAVPALAWAAAPALGPRAAWLAGGLLALAPAAITASQQVRGYAGALLASALLAGLVPATLRGVRRATPAVAAATALGLWSHPTLLLAVLAWLALALAGPRLLGPCPGRAAALRGLGLGVVAWLALAAPVLAHTFKHVRRGLLGPDAVVPRLGPLDLLDVAGGAGAGPAERLLAAGLLLAAGAGATGLVRRGRRLEAACLAAPVAAALLLLLLRAPAYPRFALFALPPLLALAAAGLASLGRRAGALGLAGLLALAVVPVGRAAREELQDLRGAARLARALAGDGPVVGAGPGGELLAAYDPRALPDGGWDAALGAPPGTVVVVPLPAFTPEEVRARLAARATPVVVPGSVSPVVVWVPAAEPVR